jgi:hypothetical protein
MPATPGRKIANEALTAAIEGVIKAYEYGQNMDGSIPMLTDYVVVATQQGYDNDGDLTSSMIIILRDGAIPIGNAVGLVELASHQMKTGYFRVDDDPVE